MNGPEYRRGIEKFEALDGQQFSVVGVARLATLSDEEFKGCSARVVLVDTAVNQR